jgi:hyperosmotically inducible protein
VGETTGEVAGAVADTTADATITSAVKMKLAEDKQVDANSIDVDTSDGQVTLTGTVGSQAEADQAVVLARGVEGVKSVTPRLTVRSEEGLSTPAR